MLFGLIFVIIFIIGFILGLAMPFILNKYPINKNIQSQKKEKEQKPSSLANEILDEYLNGRHGE